MNFLGVPRSNEEPLSFCKRKELAEYKPGELFLLRLGLLGHFCRIRHPAHEEHAVGEHIPNLKQEGASGLKERVVGHRSLPYHSSSGGSGSVPSSFTFT